METKFIIETTVDITNHIKVSKENSPNIQKLPNKTQTSMFCSGSGFSRLLVGLSLNIILPFKMGSK